MAASPAQVDPLSGNYTLLHPSDMVISYLGLDSSVTAQVFTPQAEINGEYPLTAGPSVTWPAATQSLQCRPLASAGADFNGSGLETLALLYYVEGTGLSIANISYAESTQSITADNPAMICAAAVSAVRVAAGYFDGSGMNRLAAGYTDTSEVLTLAVYDLSTASPTLLGQNQAITLASGGRFDLAAGDFDGDGIEELAVIWAGAPDADGNTVFAGVWKLSGNTLQLISTMPLGEGGDGGWVSLGAGPVFPGDPSQDQLSAAWAGTNSTANLSLLIYSRASGALSAAGTPFVDGSSYPLTNLGIVSVAVGDLDNDGVDEIVLGTQSAVQKNPDVLVLRTFRATSSGTLVPQSTGFSNSPVAGGSFVAANLDMKIGTVNTGAQSSDIATVLAFASIGTATLGQSLAGIGILSVALFPLGADLSFPVEMQANNGIVSQLWSQPWTQGPDLNIGVSISLTDYSGRSIRVGPPVYTMAEAVNGIIAAINLPPFDATSGSMMGFNVNFSQTGSQTSSLSLDTNRTYSLSDTIQGDAGLIAKIQGSLKRTYGENFTKVAEAIKSINTGLNVLAQFDDAILLSVTDYDLWEYPLFDAANSSPRGHILVIFPRPPAKLVTQGLAYNSYYAPRHQVENLLSYQAGYPPDFGGTETAIYADTDCTVGLNTSTITVSWSHSTGSLATQASKLALVISRGFQAQKQFDFLAGLSLGISADFQDTYSQSKTSTQAVNFNNAVSIQITIGTIASSDYQYMITPLVYWSTQGGHLKLDYLVTLIPDTYWSTQSLNPAPAFLLPWANQPDPSHQQLTRCIWFSQNTNGSITIEAQVCNFGQTAATGITAQFYLGPPSSGVTIGEPQSVGTVPPRGQTTVSVNWMPPAGITSVQIFCVLTWTDPSGPNSATTTGFNYYPPSYFAPVPKSLVLSANSVVAGSSVKCTIQLETVTTGDVIVTLVSSDPGMASVPPQVIVPAQSSSAQFSIATYAVAAETTVRIIASNFGVSQSAPLTLTPAANSK